MRGLVGRAVRDHGPGVLAELDAAAVRSDAVHVPALSSVGPGQREPMRRRDMDPIDRDSADRTANPTVGQSGGRIRRARPGITRIELRRSSHPTQTRTTSCTTRGGLTLSPSSTCRPWSGPEPAAALPDFRPGRYLRFRADYRGFGPRDRGSWPNDLLTWHLIQGTDGAYGGHLAVRAREVGA